MSNASELLNKAAPPFSLEDQTGKTHTLEQYRGKWVILYFYPKDMTPGCITEACSFRDSVERLTSRNAIVLGVSADTAKSHSNFASKMNLSFPLLADVDKAVSNTYGSYGEKKFMGRTFEGVLRNTYLINPDGEVVKVYESVSPKGHVDEVLKDLEVFTASYKK